MGMEERGLLSTGRQRPLGGSNLGRARGGVGAGQFAWHSWGTVSGGTHTEEVSPWHPSPSLRNRAAQDAKKAVKEKRDPVMHNRSM